MEVDELGIPIAVPVPDKNVVMRNAKRVHEIYAAARKGGSDRQETAASIAEVSGPEPGLAKLLLGIPVHVFLQVAVFLALKVRLSTIAEVLAKLRIRLDAIHFVPQSSGLNHAFTALGLARLQRDDIAGAIVCLERSWHVYPDPRNTTFGPDRRLFSELISIREAEASAREYLEVARCFSRIGWPAKWDIGTARPASD